MHKIKFSERIILILIVLLSGCLLFFCIKPGHNWGGDFALYISQAQAIIDHSVFELFAMNKYSMQNSIRDIAPYLYPNGFPLLLVPAIVFFGINFIALKLYCSLFFILSLPLIYFLFRSSFTNIYFPLFILISVALHFEFVTFSDNVLSDLPFFFFCILCFMLMKKPANIPWQLLSGGCIFFAYFIRDAGIMLLPALLISQIYEHKRSGQIREKILIHLIPYLVFILLFILTYFLLPRGSENHFKMIADKVSPGLIIQNAYYYRDLISAYFFSDTSFFLLILILIIAGVYVERKNNPHYIAFCALILLVLFIWPAQQGMRFVFPIIPFLLFFFVRGSQFVFQRFAFGEKLIIVVFSVILIRTSFNNIQQVVAFSHKETNDCYTPETRKLYSFISENIPPSEIIGFFKPTVLRLFTGINSVYIDENSFAGSPATYLLLDKNAQNENLAFEKKYESEHFVLYGK